MSSLSSLFSNISGFRLDLVVAAAGMAAAIWLAREALRRRRAETELSNSTYPTLAVICVAGIGLTEIVHYAVGGHASPAVILLVRAAILGATAGLTVAFLMRRVCSALLRSQARDHTEIELQLQRAKAAADAASRAKSDFLAVMSHEIRTPLNAVMGFANLLTETRLDEVQRDYVATITTEGHRLTSLVSDILDLSKIEEGRLILERLPFAPVDIASEVLRLLSPRALEKKIELRFEAQIAGSLLIAGDPLRFRQVILNLVDNAIKFTPEGSVTLFLAWTPPDLGASQGRLGVHVRDTGVGIPVGKLRDLFQMFTQADASTARNFGGTGLGLAICQRLVAMMGGEISVCSDIGKGAEFSFLLPCTPVAAPVESTTEGSDTPAPFSRRPRILVVDDMDTNRLLLEVFLRRNGFEPELAATGAEAIALAAKNDYDAILMDLQMPEIDGLTATQRIRSAERPGRHTPIIALTASITKGTREKCLAAGMDEYLTKPLDLRRFKSLLSTFIAGAMLAMAT
jgi:signal transduction histidine kinase/ActR/RegA family two-component response regulator